MDKVKQNICNKAPQRPFLFCFVAGIEVQIFGRNAVIWFAIGNNHHLFAYLPK